MPRTFLPLVGSFVALGVGDLRDGVLQRTFCEDQKCRGGLLH